MRCNEAQGFSSRIIKYQIDLLIVDHLGSKLAHQLLELRLLDLSVIITINHLEHLFSLEVDTYEDIH